MRKYTLLGLALASALTIGTTVAVAAPGGGHGCQGHGHHGHDRMMMMHKLNLTEAQKASIRQIIRSHRSQNKTARQALQQQRQAFEAMTPGSAGYQAAADSLAQASARATQARVEQMANVRARVYAVLTPTQQAQAATLRAQAQARRQKWQQFKAQNPTPSGQ
ncbi:MAG: Spy/CpxP family protein refolding chaperone [Xanthomonadaceae bacterium]|nr:Spy/CpxP family protein refolding chaperone [Xanthomonadaceae bacterium]